MKALILFFSVIVAAIAMGSVSQAANKFSNYIEHERIENSTFGDLFLYKPMAPYKNFVLFASAEYGWATPSSDMARALAEEGNLVIGFSTSAYIRNALAKKSCIDANKDFTALIAQLRTRFHLDVSLRPLLFGYSIGATFVFATNLQQTKKQFQATVGAAFCPDLKEADYFCKVGSLSVTESLKGFGGKKMFTTDKAPLSSFTALNGDQDKFCKANITSEFFKSVNQSKIELQLIPEVGHSFQTEKKWKTSFLKLLDQVSRK